MATSDLHVGLALANFVRYDFMWAIFIHNRIYSDGAWHIWAHYTYRSIHSTKIASDEIRQANNVLEISGGWVRSRMIRHTLQRNFSYIAEKRQASQKPTTSTFAFFKFNIPFKQQKSDSLSKMLKIFDDFNAFHPNWTRMYHIKYALHSLMFEGNVRCT